MGCVDSQPENLQTKADGKTDLKSGSSAVQETDREVMILLDTTGSMSWAIAEDDEKAKSVVAFEALSEVIQDLDSLETKTKYARKHPGVCTVTFAGGRAHDLGHVTKANLARQWSTINFQGNTQIMPGWKLLLSRHEKHHPRHKDLLLFALVITDGVADDTRDFEEHLMTLHGKVFVVLVILGFGEEHDKALREYKQIESRNRHLRVVIVQDAPHQGKAVADTFKSFFYQSDVYSYSSSAYSSSSFAPSTYSSSFAPTYSSFPSAPSPSAPISLCCICASEEADQCLLPCMHICVCSGCSSNLLMSKTCPLCRVPIQEIRKVFRS